MANTTSSSAESVRVKKARLFRRKRRSWLFKIERTTNHGITGADLLASVCHRYSTVKKLVVKPTSSTERTAADPRFGAALLVEICFAGPQPSESCGALLCLLLGGDSVQAWPVELPRGRKRKNTIMSITDAAGAGPPRNGASGVSGILPPPLRRGEIYDEDLPQQHQPQQHLQHHHLQGMHQYQHQHQHQHQSFGIQNDLSNPNPRFPAVQPPVEARPLQSELAGKNAGGAGGSFGVGGPPFSPPGASSDTVDGVRALLPMEEVMVKPSRTECDLEGRPFPTGRMAGDGSPIASGPADDRQCHLVFTGLEETGHDLNSLRVTALFGVDAVHQTATMTSPLQVRADGRAYSSLFYPSLQEIWPELYGMPNVPVVEVDIEVEILSDSGGEYRYHGPQLKVAYHRAGQSADVAAAGEAAGGPSGGPIASRSTALYPTDDDDGEFHPIYSYPGADC